MLNERRGAKKKNWIFFFFFTLLWGLIMTANQPVLDGPFLESHDIFLVYGPSV